MSDALYKIDVSVDPAQSLPGINQVDRALGRLEQRQRTIGAANDNARGTFDRLGGSMGGATNQGGALSRVFDDIRGRAAGATPAIGGLVNSLASMGPMAAIVGGVALALAAVGSAAIQAAAQTQGWLGQIETITKSSEKAKETYAAAVQFANTTPFDTGQSVQAFVKLRQMGLAATEDRLRSFGNTASASGKSLNQMIEAVADAATGEFERLKEFGIKSSKEGDKVKFTFQGVTKSIKNDGVEITKYLEAIGNTQYAGAMAKQMAGLNGMFANVSDSLRSMLSAIGEGQLGQAVAGIGNRIAQAISGITPFLASIGNAIGGIINGVGAVINGLASMWMGFGQGTMALSILDGLTIGFNLVAQGTRAFGEIIGSVFGAISLLASQVSKAIGFSFGGAVEWLNKKFESGGRSWANSIVGTLRAAKSVAALLPQIFGLAIREVVRMFSNLGQIIKRVLSGESIGDVLKSSFQYTIRGLKAAKKQFEAVQGDKSGAAAAIDRLRGQTVAPKWDTGVDSKPDASGKKPGDKDKDKESEAAKRIKQENEFWKVLQGEVETAKLLPLAAEDYRKQLELQKILGRDLNAGEKERIGSLMEQLRTAKFMTTALDAHKNKVADLGAQQALLDLRRNGASEDQLAIEKKVLDFRTNAQRNGVNLQSAAYKASEAQLRLDELRGQSIDKQNKKLDEQAAKIKDMARNGFQYGQDALNNGTSVGDRRAAAQAERDKTLADLKAAFESKDPDTKLSAAAFNAGVKKAGDDFDAKMREIGTEFSNRMGRIADLFNDVANAIGGKLGAFVKGASNLARSVGDFKNTRDGFADQFGKAFGNKGTFMVGLGKAFGGAMAGLKIGESIADLGKMFGANKGFQSGAKIGGAIGGITGNPAIAAAASAVGGLIGQLFYKAKYGTAQLTGPGAASITGRGAESTKQATGAAGGVQQGLASLASELGGQVGKYLVSIGTYDGKWRVSTSGQTGELSYGKKNKSKATLVDFGDDQAAAIAFAIEDAVKDGAITGLAPLIQKALSSLGTQAAIQFAKDWTAAMADYKSMIDPIGAAVDEVAKPLEALRKQLVAVGASSADMAKFEDYSNRKLQAVLKDKVSGFQSLLDDLNGDAGGVTALAQLTSNLAKLDTMKTDILAGKAFDKDALEQLAGKVISGTSEVYGTNTSEAQDILGSVRSVLNGAITNTTNAFNTAANSTSTNAAIADQTNAVTATIAVGNDYLRQIATAVTSGSQLGNYVRSGGDMEVYNGRLTQSF